MNKYTLKYTFTRVYFKPFSTNFPFLNTLETTKTSGFLMFSGVIVGNLLIKLKAINQLKYFNLKPTCL